MAKKDYHLTQTGAEVQKILNEAHQTYTCPLSEVVDPIEGDICIVSSHEESIPITFTPGATRIQFDVPSKTLRWAVDNSVQTIAVAEIRYMPKVDTHYWYQPIPMGDDDEPTEFGGTIEADRSDFALVWDDDEVFAENLQHISLYAVIPAIAYEYKNGIWEERKDITDVLRYSYQSLTPAQQKQARKNITAFPGTIVNDTTATPGTSLAFYVRIMYPESGVYAFKFNGKLSDEDTETGQYKVVVINSEMNDEPQIANDTMPLVLVAEMDSENFDLYRIHQYVAGGRYKYRLERFYVKPSSGIPAGDLEDSYLIADETTPGVLDPLELEKTSNKVTTISDESTDMQYPSAKATYTFVNGIVGDIETLLNAL